MLENSSVDEAQLAQLAQLERDLTVAHNLADFANQAAIWSYNALGSSDAFIKRERHANLILRLEHASREADAIKADADAVVVKLREEKRTLALTVGAHVINSKEMELAAKAAKKSAQVSVKAVEEAEAKAKAKAKAEAEAKAIEEAEAKAIEEAEALAIREADKAPEQTQAVKSKRQSKAQRIAEARAV